MQNLVLLIILLFSLGCSGTSEEPKTTANAESQSTSLSGQLVFKQYCVLCHGVDGKLGLNGSKDLTISNLPMDSVLYQIRNGKGAMLPYKDVLSPTEIDSVTQYVISLRLDE